MLEGQQVEATLERETVFLFLLPDTQAGIRAELEIVDAGLAGLAQVIPVDSAPDPACGECDFEGLLDEGLPARNAPGTTGVLDEAAAEDRALELGGVASRNALTGECAGPDGIKDLLHGASALMPVLQGFVEYKACKEGVKASGRGVGFTLQLRGGAQVELEGALEETLESGGAMNGELLLQVVVNVMVVEAGGRQRRDGGGRTHNDPACGGGRRGNEVEREGAEQRVAIGVQFRPGVVDCPGCAGLSELENESFFLLPFGGKGDGDALAAEAEAERSGENRIGCGAAREGAFVQAADEHDGQFPLASLEGIEQVDGIPAAAKVTKRSGLEEWCEFGVEVAQGYGFGAEEVGRFPGALQEGAKRRAARCFGLSGRRGMQKGDESGHGGGPVSGRAKGAVSAGPSREGFEEGTQIWGGEPEQGIETFTGQALPDGAEEGGKGACGRSAAGGFGECGEGLVMLPAKEAGIEEAGEATGGGVLEERGGEVGAAGNAEAGQGGLEKWDVRLTASEDDPEIAPGKAFATAFENAERDFLGLAGGIGSGTEEGSGLRPAGGKAFEPEAGAAEAIDGFTRAGPLGQGHVESGAPGEGFEQVQFEGGEGEEAVDEDVTDAGHALVRDVEGGLGEQSRAAGEALCAKHFFDAFIDRSESGEEIAIPDAQRAESGPLAGVAARRGEFVHGGGEGIGETGAGAERLESGWAELVEGAGSEEAKVLGGGDVDAGGGFLHEAGESVDSGSADDKTFAREGIGQVVAHRGGWGEEAEVRAAVAQAEADVVEQAGGLAGPWGS